MDRVKQHAFFILRELAEVSLHCSIVRMICSNIQLVSFQLANFGNAFFFSDG
jgi:hypothetical protein